MTRKILACTVSAAALSFGVATAAMAQNITINGGGSTLAQPTYDQEFCAYGAATGGIAPSPCTGTNPSVFFSYDGVGSGAGQSAFLNNDITLFNVSAKQFGTISGTTVDFGASDAALSSTQVMGYSLASTDGPLIQIPTIGTPITIPYVNSKLAKLTLTDAQLCGVFSGKINTWTALNRNAAAGTIEVVYRSDGSGTTFLFTQHLHDVCNSTNSNFPGGTPAVVTTFATLFGGSPPSNFIKESGSGGVAAEMLATPLTIGYLSPDYTSIAPRSPNTTSLLVSSLTNATNSVNYSPTVANTTLGLDNPGPTSTNGTPPVGQAAANPLNWVPLIPTTTQGYPIVGYTTFDLSTCYADAAVGANLISFIGDEYSNGVYTKIVGNNGFSSLANTKASKYISAVTNTFLTNKSKDNLNIGGAACSVAGVTGR